MEFITQEHLKIGLKNKIIQTSKFVRFSEKLMAQVKKLNGLFAGDYFTSLAASYSNGITAMNGLFNTIDLSRSEHKMKGIQYI